ncbi:ABC transporter permease [Thermococcus sp. 21S9]|uniref:ABC transporter permease n=1 Tax=Thermococcus sp. 21S9 TaxID=1638223 RepID=UPI00143C99C9|nr:ABC transporter permease [Thermococcus sp. 21S9]NJE54535.1 ABC transporter permease [Thermococcus sp. 21S9]
MRWVDFKDSVKRFWSDFKHQKSGMFGLFFLIVLIVLAIAAPYITSPNIPKEWQTGTAWITNPKNAPPSWENYFTSEKRATQVEYTEKNLHIVKTENGSYTVYKMTFTYDMNYDVPPKDIVITGLNSTATKPQDNPVVTMYVERPKEDGLKYNTMMLLHNTQLPSSGVIQLAYTQQVKSLIFYWLYENGVFKIPMQLPDSLPMDMKLMYLTQQIQMNSTLYGYFQSMDPMRVIFGKMTDNGKLRPLDQIINSPEPLKGTYKFTIVITAPSYVKVDFSNFKVAMVGRTYGLLGTDQYGRPIAIGLLWGIRVALAIGISVSVSTVLIGILVGVTSAYLGGWADEAIQRFTEFMMTLPVLPMLILLSLYFGGRISLKQLVFILVLFGWMGTTKVARSMALQIKEQTYVEAARALGASTGRIVFKHIVPQLLPYAFASIALSVPGAILSEAGLSFLGLTSNNMITWGQMLNNANANGATLNGYWWQVIPPGLAIAFVGLIFVLIGVSLDTVLNPRLKRA